MTLRTQVHGLQVATKLYRFIEDQVLPATGVKSATFWKGFDALVSELAPRNIALLAERDRIQTAIVDLFHPDIDIDPRLRKRLLVAAHVMNQ